MDFYSKFMVGVGLFISSMVLPHIYKMISVQSSLGQSPIAPAGLCLALFFWIIYGIKIKDKVIITTNVVGITANITYLATILYYSK